MEDKPIIRHCLNCKYCEVNECNSAECKVFYKYVFFMRIKALFCRFYKKKDNENGKC